MTWGAMRNHDDFAPLHPFKTPIELPSSDSISFFLHLRDLDSSATYPSPFLIYTPGDH